MITIPTAAEGVVIFSSKTMTFPLVLLVRESKLVTLEGLSPIPVITDLVRELGKTAERYKADFDETLEKSKEMFKNAPSDVRRIMLARGTLAAIEVAANPAADVEQIAEEMRELKSLVRDSLSSKAVADKHICDCPTCRMNAVSETEFTAIRDGLEENENSVGKDESFGDMLKGALEGLVANLTEIIESNRKDKATPEQVKADIDQTRGSFDFHKLFGGMGVKAKDMNLPEELGEKLGKLFAEKVLGLKPENFHEAEQPIKATTSAAQYLDKLNQVGKKAFEEKLKEAFGAEVKPVASGEGIDSLLEYLEGKSDLSDETKNHLRKQFMSPAEIFAAEVPEAVELSPEDLPEELRDTDGHRVFALDMDQLKDPAKLEALMKTLRGMERLPTVRIGELTPK
jgi:hypothetical protein